MTARRSTLQNRAIFSAIVLGHLAFGAANEDVGLDADLPQLLDAVLRRLGLGLAGRLEIRDQRQVDVEAVVLADVEGELADRFEERQPFDVADGAADLGDDHVHVVGGQLADGRLDLVGDVRDDLHGLAEVVAVAFLLDDRLVDLAGGEVAVAAQRGVGEAFVVAEVEVGFGAVVEDVDLAVLVGAHGAGIDVDVGVELLQADAQAAMFQQHADGGAGEPFAEGTDHAAGDENVLGLLGRGRYCWLARSSPLTGRRVDAPIVTIPGGATAVEAVARPAFTRPSRGPTLPVLPPGGDEALVIVVGVHARRAVADDADLNAPAERQDAQLFQLFQLLPAGPAAGRPACSRKRGDRRKGRGAAGSAAGGRRSRVGRRGRTGSGCG